MPRADGVAEVGLARVRAQREVRVPTNIFVMLINIFVCCQHGYTARPEESSCSFSKPLVSSTPTCADIELILSRY